MTTNQANPKNQPTKKPGNFAEALLELGGRRTNTNSPDRQNQAERPTGHVEHDWQRKELRQKLHQEIMNTQVYSRENEEVKQKIEEVLAELKKLAAEIATLGSDIDKAVHEAVVNPGTYHVNFFEALRRFLLQLRKRVHESSDWLAISSQRKQAQNHYWGGVKKAGTSFMLSNERTLATQAG